MDHITVPKIALYHIATVEKLPSTSLGCPLIFRCKNFQVAHFVLDSDLVCHEVYISLLKLSQPALPEDIYAFSYNPKSSKEMRENGWKLIDPISDFERMGIPNRYWTITDANRSYEAAICRCSQPLSGFYTRCVDDKLLLEAISQTNPGSQFMYVIDTRPKLNATANRAAGKGYENEDSYANIRFRFMGIENIHVMWSSLQKLLEVCELKTPTMSEFLRGLESSGWLRHIKALWMLEFSLQRCGHLDGDSKEVSPIFTQFLDCIWQLMEQFPCAFEFNENFLLEIHDHVFSCQFGNFLGNCQKDREDLRLDTKEAGNSEVPTAQKRSQKEKPAVSSQSTGKGTSQPAKANAGA